MARKFYALSKIVPKSDEPWCSTVHEIAHAKVYPAPGARQIQKAGVYSPDGHYFWHASYWRYGKPLLISGAEIDFGLELPFIKGNWIWGGVLFNHFGHFLTESTTRLWTVDDVKDKIDGIVFIMKRPRHTAEILNYQRELFDILVPGIPIHIVTAPTQFENLIVGGQAFGLGEISKGTEKFRAHSQKQFANKVKPKGAKKVYVSRSRMGLIESGILFEDRLDQLFESEGYSIFYPEKHNIIEQVEQYMAAENLIFADGSGIHLYGMLGHKTAKVGMISRRDHWNDSFKVQVESFGLNEFHVFDPITHIWKFKDHEKRHDPYVTEIDFEKLQFQLIQKEFLGASKPWKNPTQEEIKTRLDETFGDAELEMFTPETQG